MGEITEPEMALNGRRDPARNAESPHGCTFPVELISAMTEEKILLVARQGPARVRSRGSRPFGGRLVLGIYENAGWTGNVDSAGPRPKEFVIDYFRAYRKAADAPIVSGATYKIRNVATGRYLDSEATNNAVIWNSDEIIADSLWSFEQYGLGL
jgi:hypothetical protein